MSLPTWCRQGPCKPSSCATFMLNSHWGRAATGKKSLVSMHAGLLPLCPTLCNPVDSVRLGFSVRGVFQAKIGSVLANTGYHTLLEHNISCCPSHQLPSTWCCQNSCQPSSCIPSTPGLHRGKPKSSRAASGANPSGRPTCRSEN